MNEQINLFGKTEVESKKETSTKTDMNKYNLTYCYEQLTNSYFYDIRKEVGGMWENDKNKVIERIKQIVNGEGRTNSGHSDYCLKMLINDYKEDINKVADFILKHRIQGIENMRETWKNELTNHIKWKWLHNLENYDMNYLRNVYEYYINCCKEINYSAHNFEYFTNLEFLNSKERGDRLKSIQNDIERKKQEIKELEKIREKATGGTLL